MRTVRVELEEAVNMAAKPVEEAMNELKENVKAEFKTVENELVKLKGLLRQFEENQEVQTAELQKVSDTIVGEVGHMKKSNDMARGETSAWMRTAEIAMTGLDQRMKSAETRNTGKGEEHREDKKEKRTNS